MQNSALGCVLALAHFGDPLVALPCALSATTHSLVGSALAALWQRQDRADAARRRVAPQPPAPTTG